MDDILVPAIRSFVVESINLDTNGNRETGIHVCDAKWTIAIDEIVIGKHDGAKTVKVNIGSQNVILRMRALGDEQLQASLALMLASQPQASIRVGCDETAPVQNDHVRTATPNSLVGPAPVTRPIGTVCRRKLRSDTRLRNVCLDCKKRKVGCDRGYRQQKPANSGHKDKCGPCVKRGADCVYRQSSRCTVPTECGARHLAKTRRDETILSDADASPV